MSINMRPPLASWKNLPLPTPSRHSHLSLSSPSADVHTLPVFFLTVASRELGQQPWPPPLLPHGSRLPLHAPSLAEHLQQPWPSFFSPLLSPCAQGAPRPAPTSSHGAQACSSSRPARARWPLPLLPRARCISQLGLAIAQQLPGSMAPVKLEQSSSQAWRPENPAAELPQPTVFSPSASLHSLPLDAANQRGARRRPSSSLCSLPQGRSRSFSLPHPSPQAAPSLLHGSGPSSPPGARIPGTQQLCPLSLGCPAPCSKGASSQGSARRRSAQPWWL
jgi:hypothetical protein